MCMDSTTKSTGKLLEAVICLLDILLPKIVSFLIKQPFKTNYHTILEDQNIHWNLF